MDVEEHFFGPMGLVPRIDILGSKKICFCSNPLKKGPIKPPISLKYFLGSNVDLFSKPGGFGTFRNLHFPKIGKISDQCAIEELDVFQGKFKNLRSAVF